MIKDVGSIEALLATLARKKYSIVQKQYYTNIIGVRANTGFTNTFDDVVCALFLDNKNAWQLKVYQATTDPGGYWLVNPMDIGGTAILFPEHYVNSHSLDLHRGEYKALCQRRPLKIYRDGDKDKVYDCKPDKTTTGVYGINIHRASQWSKSSIVDKWSAGCQVLAEPKNFDELMNLCDVSAKIFGNYFNYSLLVEQDFEVPKPMEPIPALPISTLGFIPVGADHTAVAQKSML